MTNDPHPAGARRRLLRAALWLSAAGASMLLYRRLLGTTERPSWPPPPDAVTSAGAQAATEAFAARDGARPRHAALPFAWSTAATIEPWVEGAAFYPRIAADVEAARSSVHVLMFGWRAGDVGRRLADLLHRKLADGVEVRMLVDGFGSMPYRAQRAMFTELAAAGAQIVVNDVLPPDRSGLYPDRRRIAWRQEDLGRCDHRKLLVLDGQVAWTGGAGFEDHFHDGGFHDVMVRVTGDVVRQMQAALLTSFHAHGGPLPAGLSASFPEPADPGRTPVVLAQVIPVGHVAATQAIRAQIEGARGRLDVVNPYLTDHGMLERIVAAARRGVRTRMVISERSNNGPATAALKHRYPELLGAGVEIWEVPGTVVHAKVVVADDTVSFGTVNIDAWALYRNSELMVLARSAEAAARFEERLVEPAIAASKAGVPPSRLAARASGWLWDRLATLL